MKCGLTKVGVIVDMQVWRKKLENERGCGEAADMAIYCFDTQVAQHCLFKWCFFSQNNDSITFKKKRKTYQQHPKSMPLRSSVFCCAIRGGEMLKRAGHLLGNLAWAWDVRTSLCDNKLGWTARLGARAGLGTCATPGWLMGAKVPITVPRDKEAAPSTCCPKPLFPEETGVAVWALWAAVPTTVKHKAMGVWG